MINILGICEVRWTGAGRIFSGKYTVIYSGGQKHENGAGFILHKEHAKSLKGFWTLSHSLYDKATILAKSPWDTFKKL